MSESLQETYSTIDLKNPLQMLEGFLFCHFVIICLYSYMTKADLIKQLENIDDNVELNFFLLPDDEGLRDHDDSNDEALEYVGEICTSGLDSDSPFLDIGLERTNKK